MQNPNSLIEWLWESKLMWTFMGLFVLGSVARTLISDEPFNIRRFSGELIFSIIGAIAMYSMGIMQGMTEIQMVGFGALSSLGGVRAIEWSLKIMKSIQNSGGTSEN